MKINNYILGSIKDLSLDQLKVFYLAICKRKPGASIVTINYYEIMDLFKSKKASKRNIVDIVVGINKRITIINFKSGDIINTKIFDNILFVEDENEFYFKFNDNNIYLNSEIIPTLVDNDCNFSEIILDNMFKLNKKYSGNMYELYCRFKNQKIYKMPIDKLSYFFDVPKKYSSSEMERAVLNTSIKEIKSKLGISITYTKEKKNGKITHYVFKFK